MATFEQFRDSFPVDNDVKGKRFETFLCHWLLKEHPVYKNKFRKVWHFEDWPKRWSPRDIGTDLIAEDTEGKICAIQAKFYRAENYIPKGHVDSFLADSSRDVVDYRLLIATTDRIGINATNAIEGQAIPVQMFLLSDFLSAPLSWPNGSDSFKELKAREPHEPRPHQQAAIDDVCEKLNGRGQLIMACGTGKTLTGQRIAEKLEAKTTLVLLPSLLLLSKTVSDWLVEAKQDFRFLPVCSDKSVTKKVEDEIELSTSELSVGTTTDADEIASFLKRRGNKVIFSTYQSSPKIAEAFTKHSLRPFDLIIADEAHRCAGKSSADYSTVLDGELLPAKHRLFMTATPRTFKAHVKKKAKENDIEIASMDDETIFGPVLHHLTFGQAIANDPPLLTDYRVLVIGVNKDSVKEMVEERTLVRTEEGVEDDARSLAIQVGLAKAIRDYDLKRVITFHSKISLAKNFASSFNEFKDHLKEDQRPSGSITYEHVSGKMPTSERSNKLRALGALKGEDRYLLANARCLSEGVDVPALDGVAFVDPKRSEIDIIQAVGRAIRLSDDKETGTIVIPVFLSDSDDPDEVISASEFDQVWKVVNALRSHDETLGEELDELRVQMGRKQKISLRGSKIVFDVHQQVGDEFIEAFETKLVETSTASWEYWYGLLEEFVQSHGHARVASKHELADGEKLGVWCDTQRFHYEKGTLASQRVARLEVFLDRGWVWSLKDSQREKNIDVIKQYFLKNQHTLIEDREQFEVVSDNEISKVNIGGLAKGLKQAKAAGTLEQHWIDVLEKELYFKWDIGAFWWNSDYKALRRWSRVNKTAVPPKKTKIAVRIADKKTEERDIELFRTRCVTQYSYWVTNKGEVTARKIPPRRLTDKQISALERIPYWVWDARFGRWLNYYNALLQFIKREGNPHVPANKHKETMPDGEVLDLSRWLSKQRVRFKSGELEQDRIEKLNKIGFDWSGDLAPKKKKFKLDDSDMSGRVDILSDYVREHGHAVVKQDVIFKGFKLGSMVGRWRAMYHGKDRRREMPSELKRSLEAVHPTWMWSAADAREGIAQPVRDTFANDLLSQRPDHEISKVIRLGLFAGFRLFDAANFDIRQLHGVFCLHVDERGGYGERYIPVHGALTDLSAAKNTPQALGTFYRRLPQFKDHPAEQKILFGSLHVTFRTKLAAIGLDSEIINGLSGWNPRIDWDAATLLQAKAAIQQITYI
ncbi:Helicase associated domain protein [Pseudomonadales bacterium]|nr:Helicase associated domain protein [Pseudomonadales bacterium]